MTEESKAFTRALWELFILLGLIVFAAHLEGMRTAILVAVGETFALLIATIHIYSWNKFFLKIWQKRGGLRWLATKVRRGPFMSQ